MNFYNRLFYDSLPLDYHLDIQSINKAQEIAYHALNEAIKPYSNLSLDEIMIQLEQANDLGFSDALYYAGWIHQYQPSILVDGNYYNEKYKQEYYYQQAEYYYKQAMKCNSLNAIYALGILYIFGSYGSFSHHGTKIKKGIELLIEACFKGHNKAKEGLIAIISNDIYTSRAQIVKYLYDLKNSDKKELLKYNKQGLLVFDPDELGLLNFHFLYCDVLIHYFKYSSLRLNNVIMQLLQKMLNLVSEYEQIYLKE